MSNGETVLRWLDDIAGTSGRLAKEALLEAALKDELFLRVVKAAYDPFLTYGLVPSRTPGELASFDLNDPYIWNLLDILATRKLTGNLARSTVESLMAKSNFATAEVIWRILSKDLRAGFTEGSVNRVRPGTITVFEVQLSKPYEAKRVKKWPVWVEPKLDGLRTICLVQNGEAKFLSRTGKEFTALEPLKAPVEAWAKATGQSNFVIEGEAISGDFAETTGAVRRKSELATTTEFHVFDLLPLNVISEGAKSEQFIKRRRGLEVCAAALPAGSPIKIVPGEYATSHEEVIAIYDRYRDTNLSDYLGRGHAVYGDKKLEGAIVKLIDAPYERKRTWGWMKLKAQETEDLRVIGVFVGEGKYSNSLGGLVVERPFKGSLVEVRVGGGFSDAQRAVIWATPSGFVGRLIEVEFHEETPDGSLRHPRFVRFRDDKDRGVLEAAE